MSEDLTLNTQDHAIDQPQRETTWQGPYARCAVDIFETPEGLTLVADLPGVTREQITLDLADDTLTITARAAAVEERWRPLLVEDHATAWMRQFKLGQQLDQANIHATLQDGVLTLTVPRASKHQPRQITIA